MTELLKRKLAAAAEEEEAERQAAKRHKTKSSVLAEVFEDLAEAKVSAQYQKWENGLRDGLGIALAEGVKNGKVRSMGEMVRARNLAKKLMEAFEYE